LIYGIVEDVIFLMYTTFIAIMFFKKSSGFRFHFVLLLFVISVSYLVTIFWMKSIPQLNHQPTIEHVTTSFVSSLFWMFVWIPYLFLSKRAQNTFVN